jgi:hypothetical protein
MDDLLRFLKTYEAWIYAFLGIAALIGLRNLIRAWEDWRGAVFGLERESALMRLRGAVTLLVFVIGLALLEFITVSFVYPTATALQPLPTPTVALLETPLPAPLATPTGPTPRSYRNPSHLPRRPPKDACRVRLNGLSPKMEGLYKERSCYGERSTFPIWVFTNMSTALLAAKIG